MNSGVHETKVWNSQAQLIETIPEDSNQVGMFTEKTVKIMPKIHIDLISKVLDLVCTIYNAGADRYLVNENGMIDEEQTNLLMEIYNEVNIQKTIVEIYKQGYLFNTILVNPVWREDKIDLDIITPNFCSVKSYDDNYSEAEEVMISKSIDNEDMIVIWSDTEHYYMNMHGEKFAVTDENGNSNSMINPYAEMPIAVLRFQCSSDFWGEPQQDLIENNIWYDVQESNKFFVEMFQGLGVGLGINLSKNGTVSLSPNTLICVDEVRQDFQPPSLTFSSTGAPLTELRESLDYFYKRIGNSKGLSSQAMTNDVTDQSGISKAYDSAELQIKKDAHKIVMKQFEHELYEKIRMVYNYNTTGIKLNENLEFRVDIIEDEPMINVSDEIAITEFKLDKNMISIIDLMIKDNPDLTTEEAMKRLEENKILNEKYLTLNNTNGTSKESNTGNSQSGNGNNIGNSSDNPGS